MDNLAVKFGNAMSLASGDKDMVVAVLNQYEGHVAVYVDFGDKKGMTIFEDSSVVAHDTFEEVNRLYAGDGDLYEQVAGGIQTLAQSAEQAAHMVRRVIETLRKAMACTTGESCDFDTLEQAVRRIENHSA